jgi:hypothetical protein
MRKKQSERLKKEWADPELRKEKLDARKRKKECNQKSL